MNKQIIRQDIYHFCDRFRKLIINSQNNSFPVLTAFD